MKINSCQDCIAEKEATGQQPRSKPSFWCEREYNCAIAKTEPPSQYLFWLIALYKLSRAGYTIDNNDLSLETWFSLGELSEALENNKEKDRLMAVGHQMYSSIVSGLGTKRAGHR